MSEQTQDEAERAAVAIYGRALAVTPVRRTHLVNVLFDSADPELAAAVANAHAQAYIESMLEARLAMTQSATAWMSTSTDLDKECRVVALQ